MTPATGVQNIRANGWRQGALVRVEDHRTLPQSIRDEMTARARVLVVSQDCDLVHESYESEPKIEVILATAIERKQDGNLTHGKNPRQLQVPFDDNNAEVWFQCNAADRYFIKRDLLETITPADELSLTKRGGDVLVRWLVNRYQRAAFPDEFNRRLAPIQKRCERQLRKLGGDLIGICLRLNTQHELPDSRTYQIILFGVMDQDGPAGAFVQKLTVLRKPLVFRPDGFQPTKRCPGFPLRPWAFS